MSNSVIELRYKYYPDPTKGKPVYLGYIFIGEPNTDPEVLINQKQVSMSESCICSEAPTPISQPIRTSAGGVPVFNGSPVVLFVDGPYSIKVLNSKMEQVYYDGYVPGSGISDTVADLILLSIEAGVFVETGGYYAKGDGGAARYLIVESQAADEFGDHTLANNNVAVLQDVPSLPNFGGKADSTTDNKLNMEAIIARTDSLFVANLFLPYKISTVAIPRNYTLYGDSKFGNYDNAVTADGMHFIGDGVNPVFTFGDGVNSAQRRQTIHSLRVFNDGAQCVLIDNAPEWSIHDCLMRSENITDTNKGCIQARFSYRAKVKDNNLSCTGGGWAFVAMNNMNGLELHGNTATGGGSGGAFTIGQSQAVSIRYNILEAGLKSIYVGSDDNPENGLCSGIDISDNYIEQTRDPIHIGTLQIVRGGQCVNNYVGNTIKTSIPDRDATIKYGRIQSYNISNNALNIATDENVFDMVVNLADGQIEDNSIMKNRIQGTPLNAFVISGTFGTNASVLRTVGSQNYFDFMGSRVASQDFVEFISPLMTCNVTLSATAYLSSLSSELGGKVLSVEVIEATGALDGLLRIGRIGAQTETVDQDLSLLVLVDGSADVTLATATPTLSTTESNTIRLTPGVLTTQFRFRIRYKAV